MKNSNRKGFTLIESLIVVVIVGIVSTVAVMSLVGRKSYKDFSSTVEKIVSVLNTARDKSIVMENNVGWNVVFRAAPDNPPGTKELCIQSGQTDYFPHFKITGGGYDDAIYSLPSSIAFNTALGGIWGSPCAGPRKFIYFDRITGFPEGGPASVTIYLVSNPSVSSTISVSALGLVSFTTSSVWSGY